MSSLKSVLRSNFTQHVTMIAGICVIWTALTVLILSVVIKINEEPVHLDAEEMAAIGVLAELRDSMELRVEQIKAIQAATDARHLAAEKKALAEELTDPETRAYMVLTRDKTYGTWGRMTEKFLADPGGYLDGAMLKYPEFKDMLEGANDG